MVSTSNCHPRGLGFDSRLYPRTGVSNLLSSRANLHLSYNPAGRSHCRLQNHHGYINHHHRGMDYSPEWRRWSAYGVGEGSPTSQLILQPFRCFTHVIDTHLHHSSFPNPSAASCTPQLILQPFRRYTYVKGHSTTLSLLRLRHRHFTYFTWRATHA